MTADLPIDPTLTPGQAAARRWDAAILGAGPAGAALAALLGRRGLAVLLVDRATFPRPKACGGCVNAAALAILEDADLARPARREAIPTRTFRVAAGGRTASIPLAGGAAISRTALDAALVRDAIAAGAHLATNATLRPARGGGLDLAAVGPGERCALAANVVVLASGLSASPLAETLLGPRRVARRARVGLHAMAPSSRVAVPPGTIAMGVGRDGYAGAVRVEDGQTDIAMAARPAAVRAAGGPSAFAAALLRPLLGTVDPGVLRWMGTPPLTQRPARIAAPRVFAVGDAAGYVEPFTGEGLAWALAGSRALSPLVARAARGWDDALADRWIVTHRRLVAIRQRRCRIVAAAVRIPRLVGTVLGARALAARLADAIARPYPPAAEIPS